MISQKCQYALRAVFELARRYGKGPVKIADIAEVQAIPVRFLEVILGQLKQAGFLESRRGTEGGYLLAVRPSALSVGEVIRYVEGPLAPVDCKVAGGKDCPLQGSCVFTALWARVESAVSDVYDHTSFQDMVDEERVMCSGAAPTYAI